MAYIEKKFTNLNGIFSDKLTQAHLKLYSGYVANTNKSLELLKTLEPGTPQWAEVKRRLGWEFNGMRLHELYFGNMGKNKKTLSKNSPLLKKIIETFGSLESCQKDFVNTGKLRGIGWVVMYYDKEADELFNIWVNEHDVGHFAGCVPLLVMDVFEHAFVTDYGMDRASYIDAFINSIDWDVVSGRF